VRLFEHPLVIVDNHRGEVKHARADSHAHFCCSRDDCAGDLR
jgi:hypothetical protein